MVYFSHRNTPIELVGFNGQLNEKKQEEFSSVDSYEPDTVPETLVHVGLEKPLDKLGIKHNLYGVMPLPVKT